MYYLTLGSIFVMPSGARKDSILSYFGLIFVMSSGARKDNVLSYFGCNLCNALLCKEGKCIYLLWGQSLLCFVEQGMTTNLLTLESFFVTSKGAKITMFLLTLESIFVLSKGARNDNVFTYFKVNL